MRLSARDVARQPDGMAGAASDDVPNRAALSSPVRGPSALARVRAGALLVRRRLGIHGDRRLGQSELTGKALTYECRVGYEERYAEHTGGRHAGPLEETSLAAVCRDSSGPCHQGRRPSGG